MPVRAQDTPRSADDNHLYGPYGGGHYQSGVMPTDYGYTGQHHDAATGLDYYNARYYDPAIGQFASADTTIPSNGYDPWGLSRYAYVEGNPLIRTDPTGHDGLFGGLVQAVSSAVSTVASTVVSVVQATVSVAAGVVDAAIGISSMCRMSRPSAAVTPASSIKCWRGPICW